MGCFEYAKIDLLQNVANIKKISKEAFNLCTKLTSIILSDNLENVDQSNPIAKYENEISSIEDDIKVIKEKVGV